jgi:Flp pilus assembly protein TadD
LGAALAAYQNSFSDSFIFDDLPAIVDNSTIRQLGSTGAWSPPIHSTVSGRPAVNFSLALSYAISGPRAWGYHAFNLGIHLLAGLTLFGVIRRTLLQPVLRPRFGSAALPLAFAATLLWILHPLQTESVTYLAQRAESLMGLFYLLTLYAFIRSAESRHTKFWPLLAVIACAFGMASKEVMVSAPLVVLLYDRTFLAGTFRDAWRQRRGLYLGLAGTWLLLGGLVLGNHNRGGSAGFGLGVAPLDYALTQVGAIAHYLYLSVWPRPLIFDYGSELTPPSFALLGPAAVVLGLLAGTGLALWRWPVVGFVGVWFFAILAPSSSFVPVASQTIAEHRMYLSLAAPIILIVTGLNLLLGRWSLLAVAALATALGFLTAQRNEDYRSPLSIWSDTVAKRPENPRAQDSLGNALVKNGRVDEAIPHFAEAVRLSPHDAKLRNNLGNGLALLGRSDEAMVEFKTAIRLKPDYADAHYNLGLALDQKGRTSDAIVQYEAAVQLNPDHLDAQFNLGCVLVQTGQVDEAIAHFEQAARLRPNDPETLAYLARLRALKK